MSNYDDNDLDDRVYEEAMSPRGDESDREENRDKEDAEDKGNSGEAGDEKKDGDKPDRPKRPRFDLPADKYERKRSPQFLLTHNPDLDLGCDCLQLVQAYGTNRTKWKPKWNIERKDDQYRADLDVCIRDSSDLVLVRGHWCDTERNAKRSAAVEGCKRLIEKGEKRNLMRLAVMVGAWVFISKHGDGSDHELGLKIVAQAKEIMENGDFKRGGERNDPAEGKGEGDDTKVCSRRNALEIVDSLFDQVWGEKRFIRRQPIYEVDQKAGHGTTGYKIVVTIPKFKGTFEEDTPIEGPVGETILDARRNVAWEIAVKLHEKGKLPNHTLNENAGGPIAASSASGTQSSSSSSNKRQTQSQTRPSYSERDRERDRERERERERDRDRERERDRDDRNHDRAREREDRDDRERRDRRSDYDESDVRSERRRSRSPVRDAKRKDRDEDYGSDAKRRKRD